MPVRSRGSKLGFKALYNLSVRKKSLYLYTYYFIYLFLHLSGWRLDSSGFYSGLGLCIVWLGCFIIIIIITIKLC